MVRLGKDTFDSGNPLVTGASSSDNHTVIPYAELEDFFSSLDRMILEAKTNVGVMIGRDVLEWLPAAENHFYGL